MNGSPRACSRRRARGVFTILLVPTFSFAPLLSAAIIGTNTPAQPLTAQRITMLPAEVRPAWKEYRERSERQMRTDQNFLQKEMRQHGIKEAIVPPSSRHATSIVLNKPAVWYGEAEARRIADIVVSFQTPAGGWSKNLDLSQHPRAPGEGFAPNNSSRFLGEVDYDTPHDTNWSYVGTFDNNATTTQLRYLAKVIATVGARDGAPYRDAFLRGLDYIFAAQYPNGGWPQVWPLQGGYHDAITYNDNAIVNILSMLRDVSEATNEFAFVPGRTRALAAASLKRGIECIVASQIVVDGRRTVWCQQHDALTLRPASARNYEMPSSSGSESVGIVLFLMQLAKPTPQVVTAVRAAVAWFEKTKIPDVAYHRTDDGTRHLVSAPGSGPLWARYYEINTDRPIFGDRDKSIHDNLDEISPERRRGYSWYGDGARQVLDRYALWSKAHP